MIIAIGGDRCGFLYKTKIIEFLKTKGIEVLDVGTYKEIPGDSPVFAYEVGKRVASGEADYGILICATGTGISIAANKMKGIMCGIGYDDEVTVKMREHNDANVIAFGQDHIPYEDVERRIWLFLNTKFGGKKHHALRIQQIHDLEEGKAIQQTPILNVEWKKEV